MVADIQRCRTGQLRAYKQQREQLPIKLTAWLHDEQTEMFSGLLAQCAKPTITRRERKEWVSEDMWRQVAKQTSMPHSSQIGQAAARRMKREIAALFKQEKLQHTAEVGDQITANLESGNVQEAFWHLKGWYCTAEEVQAWPCPQTMERQTRDCIELYEKSDLLGDLFPADGVQYNIRENALTNGEIRTAVAQMRNGRCGGAFGIRAEELNVWLQGIEQEETAAEGTVAIHSGRIWREFVKLVQYIWINLTLPEQMNWVITVLIPKGGGDYRGIGLLEPIWKCTERVMDHRLDTVTLHDSLHG